MHEVRAIASKGVLLCAVMLWVAGCSFQSELSEARCGETGVQRGGKVCQNGFWVSADAGAADACTPSTEKCNGTDDDCDGVVDESCSCDYDGSTVGVCADGGVVAPDGTCRAPSNWTADEGETGGCGDGLDNDCDGSTEEGCSCTPGKTRECYGGPPKTKGVGACRGGMQRCTNAGTWGECATDVTPKADETKAKCPNGNDDDCDGIVDEGCPCDVNGADDGGMVGVCTTARLNENGVCPSPDNYIQATDDESTADACDGLDNDCDGATDEGCPCAYDPNESSLVDTDWSHAAGVCAGQTRKADGTCERPTDFESKTDTEICDQLDNDCDGLLNEGCGCSMSDPARECYGGPPGSEDTGQCDPGSQECVNRSGSWVWSATCKNQRTPKEETCSGKDADKDMNCNGYVDDGCPCNYNMTKVGVCAGQTRDSEGECREPQTYVMDENAGGSNSDCDGKDNDCDDTIDEGCPCNYKQNSKGVCSQGVVEKGGSCGKPDAYIKPGEKEDGKWCDGKDNDCDGKTDESSSCMCVNGTTRDCYTGPMGKAGVGICVRGDAECKMGQWGMCKGDELPKNSEDCNDKDDDCDGVTDEGCPCNYKDKSAGVCSGQTIDMQGNCGKPLEYESTETSCKNSDNKDNDCDGKTDYGDRDCKKSAGSQCQTNRECLGICKSYMGGRYCMHRLFVTSQTWQGNLGGLSGADQKCNQLASQANLGGNWKAVLSVMGTHARDRIQVNARIYNLSREKLADDKSDLWDGKLHNDVDKNEKNKDHHTLVWSGSHDDGRWDGSDGESDPDDCSDWTSNQSSDAGEVGHSDRKNNGEWISDGDGTNQLSCDQKAALYCVDGQ